MIEAMTDGELEAIKFRHSHSVPYTGGREPITDAWIHMADRDRGQLLYEIERLHAELERAIEVYDRDQVVIKDLQYRLYYGS